MSQDFKFKFDRMRDNDPTGSADNESAAGNAEKYESGGHGRNIGFVWADGKRMFLSYSYLISGEYMPGDNTIILTFTTHKVLLKGVLLENLYGELMAHLVRIVTAKDVRYNSLIENDQYAVNEIIVSKNE